MSREEERNAMQRRLFGAAALPMLPLPLRVPPSKLPVRARLFWSENGSLGGLLVVGLTDYGWSVIGYRYLHRADEKTNAFRVFPLRLLDEALSDLTLTPDDSFLPTRFSKCVDHLGTVLI